MLKVRSTSTDVATQIVKMGLYKGDHVYLEYKGNHGPFERDEDKRLSSPPTREGDQGCAWLVLKDSEWVHHTTWPLKVPKALVKHQKCCPKDYHPVSSRVTMRLE